jgi:DNA-binding transcriptional MerR regulator
MISDAAGLVNVEAHVLRYWEEELELEIPRNEMGHRYYTKENIQQFLKIKELKEQGYQLKAIKMVIHNGKNPEEAAALTTATVSERSIANRPSSSVNESASYASPEDKMAQFRILMSGIVKEALAENNQALGKEVGENVGDRVLKEMNYLMREQDEQDEERYRKLDAAIRDLNAKKLKGSAKKKESRRLFAKKEITT